MYRGRRVDDLTCSRGPFPRGGGGGRGGLFRIRPVLTEVDVKPNKNNKQGNFNGTHILHCTQYGPWLGRRRSLRGDSTDFGQSWQSKDDWSLPVEGQIWFLSREIWIRPMSSSATSTSSQSMSCMGRWIPSKPVKTTLYPLAIMECRLCFSAWTNEQQRHFNK
jgi:hypothetical protein